MAVQTVSMSFGNKRPFGRRHGHVTSVMKRNKHAPGAPVLDKISPAKIQMLKQVDFDLVETNSRIVALLKAAEDGRKRACLPPLEREPTFQRKPKYFNPYEGNADEAAESHWNKSYEKVSIEVDNRVKNHLKKQLMYRFEKRLKKLEGVMAIESDAHHGHDNRPRHGTHGKKRNEKHDIFNKYTDTGERVTHSEVMHQGHPLPEIGLKQQHKNDTHISNTSGPLSDITANVNKTVDDTIDGHVDGHSLIAREKNSDTYQVYNYMTNSASEKDVEVFAMTTVKSKFGVNSENIRKWNISPVQTPQVLRPLTREQTRLSFVDSMNRILNGQIHVSCPVKNNVIKVYICSGFRDSEAERTILMELVYPELKALCALYGREFQMIDPHWGINETVFDDHSFLELCTSNIEICTKNQLQPVNLLVLLTNKYGNPVLPTTLSIEEFKQIYDSVNTYANNERSVIRQQLELIEAPSLVKQEDSTRDGTQLEPTINEVTGDLTLTISKDKTNETNDIQNIEKPLSYRKDADIKRDHHVLQELKERENLIPDPSLLCNWYILDENSMPPVYKLQNISSVIKDFGKGDLAKREFASQNWHETRSKLLHIVNEFGPNKYNKSLYELELEHGLFALDNCFEQCVIINREIDNMDSFLDDMKADEYIDVTSSRPRVINRTLNSRLLKIKNSLLPSKVSDQYILPFQVSWAPGGIRIGGDRMHQTYLDRMEKHVCNVMKKRLIHGFREEKSAEGSHYKLFQEVAEHVAYCHDRCGHFQGMKECLYIMKAYIRSQCHVILAVHGQPGCGKSSLLAKAAKETHKWLKGTNVAVVFRSVGATKDSCNIRNLLYGICNQLCCIYNSDVSSVPTDYISLINDFSERLALATVHKPLVLYIDALDRLEGDHDGRKLAWLPKSLPEHVRVIVSTLNDEKFECIQNLKTLLGENDGLLEIPDLAETDSMIILNHLFHTHSHTLTQEQLDIIFKVIQKCPSPLFLKLLFNESLKWRSYSEVQEGRLPDSVKMMAAIKFGQLELLLGECFVRRALGYITASRNGVTDSEMLDILSIDETVMDDIAQRFELVRRRIPHALWLRLRKELSLYLTEISADNVKTVQWAHSHFYEAAKERYLNQRDKAPSYHKIMGEYFLGTWANKPKPFPGNEKGVLRYVSSQPLYWKKNDGLTNGPSNVYNLRKINELPFHLLRGQQLQLYKSETLCNFEWVLAKLCGTSLRNLIEDYHMGLEAEQGDQELKLLSDTLQLSATAVLRDSRQLAGQLVGRLQGIVNRDVPSTPGDPPRYPFLHAIVAQAQNTSIPALIPSIGCLTEPGGILYDLLSGHTKPITAITTTTDAQRALTASEDNTLKVWDLKTGRVTSTIYGFGTKVSKLRTALNNRYTVSVEGSVIKVWSLYSGECNLVFDQYLDPPVISIAGEGNLLVALFDGVNALRTWDLANECKHVCEAKIDNNRLYSDNSVVLAPNSYGDYVMHAFRGKNTATIQHAKTGKILHTLTCHNDCSAIVALAITRDYMILACRQNYMKLHELHQLEMFDAKKGKFLRSIRGCTQDIITEVHINLVGSHAIVVCASEISNTSNIAIWNLETEDHKHLAKHTGVSTVSACADFRYCLTAQKGDNTLKIWNISKYINLPTPKLKKSLGVAEIHPMNDNPRYAIARQVNHGPISIWNVAKAKCLASAVRIERGLSESSDVVLIRNCNVVILTEKGLKDSKPVFKTILIYDLRAKRYVKKVTQCFIVPSPAHEYVLLDGETLLGPDETRNHFVIWSLTTGKELFRIRPKFKDIDTKGNIRDSDLEQSLQMRANTAKMTPWDRRTESSSAKQKRRDKARKEERRKVEELQKEMQNGIEQFMISGNLNVIVASFYAHHLVVLNVATKLHTQTLENEDSMLFLHVAALNFDGSCLVHANYDDEAKISYVTLWDTNTGHVKKRLKNETDVLAIAITDDGSRVVFGKANKELRIWDPNKHTAEAMKKIKGYDSLEFGFDSKIFILNKGQRAVVFAGDISLWDLENATLLAAFTPDTRIEVVNVVMNGQLITMGVHEFPELIVLKMAGKDVKQIVDMEHEDLFGETTGDTSDEEEEEEEDSHKPNE